MKGCNMGHIAVISSVGSPVARVAPGMISQSIASLPATLVESSAIAISPVQATAAVASVAPELPRETAARLLVENAEGIVLDNIPFTNDGAILLDDLPLPEKPAPEVKPDPEPEPQPEPDQAAAEPDRAQIAARAYLADREAVAPSEPDPQPEPKAEQQMPAPAAPEVSLSRSD
jgi:hypothetical protein